MINQTELQQIIEKSNFMKLPGLISVGLLFPDSNEEIIFSSRKNQSLPQLSASAIKIFLLLVFFQLLSEKKYSLRESHYVLRQKDIVAGSGSLQFQTPGLTLSYEELIRHMLVESDNTATNIIIDQVAELSGEDLFVFINQKIKDFGFEHSELNRKMMDLNNPKSNYTDALDLGRALKKIYNNDYPFLSEYHAMIMTDMLNCDNREKLVAKLPDGVLCYHKTGENDYKGVENDAGILVKGSQSLILVCLAQYYDSEAAEQKVLGANLCASEQQIKGQQLAIADLARDLSLAYFD